MARAISKKPNQNKKQTCLSLMMLIKRKRKLWGVTAWTACACLLQTGTGVLRRVPQGLLRAAAGAACAHPHSPPCAEWHTHICLGGRAQWRRRCCRQPCKMCLLAMSNQCTSSARANQKHTSSLLMRNQYPRALALESDSLSIHDLLVIWWQEMWTKI